MKKNLFNIRGAVVAVVLFVSFVVSLTSCVREPLTIISEKEAFDLVIRPRWVELEERPSGFTAIVYPTDNSEPTIVRSNNVDSVKVSLPVGSYRVIVFNQTTDEYVSLSFRHTESYYDFEVIGADEDDARILSSYNIMSKSRMCKEPAVFAADCCNEVVVTQAEVNEARSHNRRIRKTVTMRPHILISTLYINLRVEGIYNGYAVQGCIDGMASHLYSTYYEAGEKSGAFQVPAWKVDYDGVSSIYGTYHGVVRNFGMPGTSLYLQSAASVETSQTSLVSRVNNAARSETDPTFRPEDIYLHMRVLLVDKKTIYEQSFPVGDLIERRINEPLIFDLNPKDMLVLPYVQPEDGSGASGFDADVDEWQVINKPIYM